MIEALLYAALGFFVAALLALVMMSMLWQRAVRLTQSRIEASAPTTLREMTAIRDALRAENAVALCRMEQGLNRLRTELTAKTIGYRNAQEALRVARLEATANAERQRDLEEQIAARQSRINVLEDNLAKTTQALKDASRAMKETEGELRNLEKALNDSESLADSRKVEVAALKTRINSQEGQIEDLKEQLEAGLKEKAKTEQSLQADAGELEKAYARMEDLQARLASAAAQGARREQQLAEMEARLMAFEKSNSAGNPAAMEEEAAAYLKEKLAQYAAELASFAASVEGPDGKIAAMMNQDEGAGSSAAAGPLTLADRMRLIAGKTARH